MISTFKRVCIDFYNYFGNFYYFYVRNYSFQEIQTAFQNSTSEEWAYILEETRCICRSLSEKKRQAFFTKDLYPFLIEKKKYTKEGPLSDALLGKEMRSF